MPPSSANETGFVTFDELAAKRDWILSAPKDAGIIDTLCVRPNEGERRFENRIALSPAEGVVGDRWIRKTWMHLPDGSPDPRIQVCILGRRMLDLVRTRPETMPYPADNMIADMDFSEENLPVGQRLAVGTAILEVSDVFNTACSKWSIRYGNDSIRWINLPENRPYRMRGILCRVAQAGEVALGEAIRKCR